MKKTSFLAVLITFTISLVAQGQSRSLDCSDLHKKLLDVRSNFDRLPAAYKKKATKSYGNQLHYSTKITICHTGGDLMESLSANKLMVLLDFRYDTANKADYGLRDNHVALILAELKKVFGDWDYETEAEDHGDLQYYEFREKGYYQAKVKREVTLVKHDYYNDDLSITIEFSRRNY